MNTFKMTFPKEKKNLPKFATDAAKAAALWTASEELGGVKFDLSSKSLSKKEETTEL